MPEPARIPPQCVLHTVQTWDRTVTEAEKSGGALVATDWQGTLHWEVRLDEGLSAAAIAQKYCPPCQSVIDWSVVATTNPASLPAG